MARTNLAVVGVAHPYVSGYLDDYLYSLETQECESFDLILINDGIKEIEKRLDGYGIEVNVFQGGRSVADNRRRLIEIVLEARYKKVIFTDCDDVYPPGRIATSASLLDDWEVVVNDLDVVNSSGKVVLPRYLSNRMPENTLITSKDLVHSNMMGMTNTAARTEIFGSLSNILRTNLRVFDWYLWNHILRRRNTVVFTSRTSSRYRVYGGNLSGLPQSLSAQSVRNGVEVKNSHYEQLAVWGGIYKNLHKIYSQIKTNILDPWWFEGYLASLRKNQVSNPMWWENIRTSEEVFHS